MLNRDLVLNLLYVLLYHKLTSDLHLFQCNTRIVLTFVLHLKLMLILKSKCLFQKIHFFLFESHEKKNPKQNQNQEDTEVL